MNHCSESIAIGVTILRLDGNTIATVELGSESYVSDIMDQLPRHGEYRICRLTFGVHQLCPRERLVASGLSVGENTVTAVFCTREFLISAGLRAEALMSNKETSKALRNTQNLNIAGYSARALRTTGYKLEEVIQYLPSLELLNAGYTASDFRGAGVTARGLHDLLLSIHGSQRILAILRDLLDAGYSLSELHEAGCHLSDLRLLSYFTVHELQGAGYTLSEFLSAGYTVTEILQLGFCVRDLKAAGCGAAQLKDVGYKALDLKVAGYTLYKIKQAGYTVAELKEAGYNAWVLSSSGCSLMQLRSVGFQSHELLEAGIIGASSA